MVASEGPQGAAGDMIFTISLAYIVKILRNNKTPALKNKTDLLNRGFTVSFRLNVSFFFHPSRTCIKVNQTIRPKSHTRNTMSSQMEGVPRQVLPTGMLPAKMLPRNDSPSPPPLPSSAPPPRPTNQFEISSNNNSSSNNKNNSSCNTRGFSEMDLDQEDDVKPGLSLLAHLPAPPPRNTFAPKRKPKTQMTSGTKGDVLPPEDEPQYTGYINPRKQSASFMRLAQTLNTVNVTSGGGLISSQEDLQPSSGTPTSASPNYGTPEPIVISANGQLPSLQHNTNTRWPK
jgi:hypothetical protein